jgi:SOS-response transcriptional repressor LexA
MKKVRLTKEEKRLVDFIADFVAQYGAEPSYGEICRVLRFESKGAVAKLIRALERKGVLQMEPSKPIFCNP